MEYRNNSPSPRRITSYTCITTRNVRDTIRRIRGASKENSDVDHDIEQTTPIEPWLIHTAFDKIYRTMPSLSNIASVKIEKGESIVKMDSVGTLYA